MWRLMRQSSDNVFKLLKLDKIDKLDKIATEGTKLFETQALRSGSILFTKENQKNPKQRLRQFLRLWQLITVTVLIWLHFSILESGAVVINTSLISLQPCKWRSSKSGI
ncbi:unnamed protein product [Peronospora farinosa]|uniref:Uncharacterized protein n=1 Tax=Peronospora farinosa TaxID=134698 RepID=A0AAV0SSG4_9STRA|nr:unnamed protein product [Peronospora farinosa]